MKLIVGLGNKGKEYKNTRHNIGFEVVDLFSKINKLNEKQKNNGIYFETNINGEKIVFLKPQLYMNLSGIVVKKYIDFYKIDKKDVFIISDDMDLEIGKIRLREKGSAGGHNGLRNIEDNIGSKEYKRLKIGISKNSGISSADFVLSKFNKEEQSIIKKTILISIDIINDFINLDFDNVMNKYN